MATLTCVKRGAAQSSFVRPICRTKDLGFADFTRADTKHRSQKPWRPARFPGSPTRTKATPMKHRDSRQDTASRRGYIGKEVKVPAYTTGISPGKNPRQIWIAYRVSLVRTAEGSTRGVSSDSREASDCRGSSDRDFRMPRLICRGRWDGNRGGAHGSGCASRSDP